MARKKQEELPAMDGPGVAALEIPELEKAISKYQRKKEARCQASPDEISAKTELKALLHQHRASLPINAEGVPFYRSDGRDYVLEEKLKVKRVEGADEEEE